jgi:hypothetical protein
MPSASRELVLAVIAVALVACGGTVGVPTNYHPPASCHGSSMTQISSVAPNYGYGTGPVFLSGQSEWYAAGQVAVILVDSRYRGPVSLHASEVGGDGAANITLAEGTLPDTANDVVVYKERQHGVEVVSATPQADGGLTLAAGGSSSMWRGWFGELSTTGPGCFAVHADGETFSEIITFWVAPGHAPPG